MLLQWDTALYSATMATVLCRMWINQSPQMRNTHTLTLSLTTATGCSLVSISRISNLLLSSTWLFLRNGLSLGMRLSAINQINLIKQIIYQRLQLWSRVACWRTIWKTKLEDFTFWGGRKNYQVISFVWLLDNITMLNFQLSNATMYFFYYF